jgi:hypothetical protein
VARDRAMLDTAGHHEDLAGVQRHDAVAQLDIEHAFEDEEEVVGFGVLECQTNAPATFTMRTSLSL